MKRIICVIIAVILLIITLSACEISYNRSVYDTTWNFNYGYIYIGNEKIIEGKVDSWLDFEGSDMIQVKIDGKVYLTHSTNVILVNK